MAPLRLPPRIPLRTAAIDVLRNFEAAQSAIGPAPLREAHVAIVACQGLLLGGTQMRCMEMASALTQHGLPTACVDGGCLGASRVWSKRMRLLRAIIFVKEMPPLDILARLRAITCSVLIDSMDYNFGYFGQTCRKPHLTRLLDGALVDNAASANRIRAGCTTGLGALSRIFEVEHFHSVPARVSNGSRPISRALLVQEHADNDAHTCIAARGALKALRLSFDVLSSTATSSDDVPVAARAPADGGARMKGHKNATAAIDTPLWLV